MRILMYAKGLPVHIKGGMERHIEDLIYGLSRRGYEVVILTTRHPEGITYEERDNVTIYYLGRKPLDYGEYFQKMAIKVLRKIESNIDIIHSQSDVGYGYLKYFGKKHPFVVTDHGTLLGEVKSLLNEKTPKSIIHGILLFFKGNFDYHVIRRSLYHKCADKIIAVSNELKENIKKEYRIPEDKLIVVPNGIDINKFKPINVDSLRENLNLGSEKVILSVGALTKQKGHHLLLKVLPEILKEEKVKLVIIGFGSYLQKLKDMAVKLGIENHVIFAGRVSDEELPKYYNLADIFAFPTLRMEGLPLVVPEAMACEKPVIASRIGGIPTVIENNMDGILIKPGNLKELKERIMEVLRDEELAKKLGKNARKKVVEKFNLDRMVEDTIKVYEEVLGK